MGLVIGLLICVAVGVLVIGLRGMARVDTEIERIYDNELRRLEKRTITHPEESSPEPPVGNDDDEIHDLAGERYEQ